MNKTWKYIIIGFCGVLLAVGFAFAYSAGAESRRTLKCERLEVEIIDSLKNSFVTPGDIRQYLDKGYGEYIGQPLDSLDLVKMEKIVDSRSAVRKSHAYVTKDGVLHIKVSQRKPVVRFQKPEGGFYADEEGYIFPLQSSYASHVQVIDGNVPLAANSGYKGSIENPDELMWFRRVMAVVNYMEGSKTWKDKIVQISVDPKGELILVPREGKEKFRFGQPVEIEEKFRKMEAYYTTIIPEKGQDAYRCVDLRNKGQIVCK